MYIYRHSNSSSYLFWCSLRKGSQFTASFFQVHTPVNKRDSKMNDVPIAARVPKQLKEKMEKAIEKGHYINVSDLVRNALREKLRGEVP